MTPTPIRFSPHLSKVPLYHLTMVVGMRLSEVVNVHLCLVGGTMGVSGLCQQQLQLSLHRRKLWPPAVLQLCSVQRDSGRRGSCDRPIHSDTACSSIPACVISSVTSLSRPSMRVPISSSATVKEAAALHVPVTLHHYLIYCTCVGFDFAGVLCANLKYKQMQQLWIRCSSMKNMGVFLNRLGS